jgi:hypothetical protein
LKINYKTDPLTNERLGFALSDIMMVIFHEAALAALEVCHANLNTCLLYFDKPSPCGSGNPFDFGGFFGSVSPPVIVTVKNIITRACDINTEF